MTRDEQIINKAIDFSEYEDNFLEYDDCGDICNDKSLIENAFISGAKWADKTMIEKACEWLKTHQDDYFDYDPWKDVYVNFDALIEDFKKAMKNNETSNL